MWPGSEIGKEINHKDHDARSIHTHESILDQFWRHKMKNDIDENITSLNCFYLFIERKNINFKFMTIVFEFNSIKPAWGRKRVLRAMTHFWTNTKVDYGNESIWMVHFWTITKTSGDYGDCTLVDQYKNECLKFKNITILELNAYFSQIVENKEFST